ncbi:glycosyltransferase involved in cell wall biosynthesis [Angulomicrobium tetraedrale]|uniref:Glycosyltransferase involved in cell wall biosynthesis n=1 Tax=Ancylobacter tetraedralis TaxID=217068 RepID=A0A839ZB66_9HYPH|nr:glycosyltransferase [Ancylobacter tetraedralis]MBB3771979.1 glycosyltransferase involved in cell wall biosynthesis [Ancylobacter tetraedralis]
MNASGQMVCLNMIVKNEADVIRRCLDSVRPIIDYWVIVDTGSTDGTQDIIREHLRGVPGELHERPWRDFAHNRSEALKLARARAHGPGDYTLIIDADDALQIRAGDELPALTADSYMVTIHDTSLVYQRPQLVRSALAWRYEGVLHEYLTCEGAAPHGQIPAISMRRNHDGARRKDPTTYRRDADMLEAALRTEKNPFLIARYRFYLAQSYRDCRNWEKALDNYLLRADLGFWQEEVFISLYCAAQMMETLGHPERQVIDACLRASDALSTRAEALHRASRLCRQKGLYEEGYAIAQRGLAIPQPNGALFVEPWIYQTGLLDELSLNAYGCGRRRDCLDATLKLLATGDLPPADVARVLANARLAAEGLPRDLAPAAPGALGLAARHALTPPRALHSRLKGAPRVFVTLLASQQEALVPLFLERLEALDYPKSAITLSIRTPDSTDGTAARLRAWIALKGALYAGVEFEAEDACAPPDASMAPRRDGSRPPRLGRLRDAGLRRAVEAGCDFCFVTEIGHVLRPGTLRELVALDLPIVAPLLRAIEPADPYSNYHSDIDANGYYKECGQYPLILNRAICGVLEQPVVNGSYLIRADMLDNLSYQDTTLRDDYVVFSESARRQGIGQYLDNRQIYGYIIGRDSQTSKLSGEMARARDLMKDDPGITDAGQHTMASIEGEGRRHASAMLERAG